MEVIKCHLMCLTFQNVLLAKIKGTLQITVNALIELTTAKKVQRANISTFSHKISLPRLKKYNKQIYQLLVTKLAYHG